MLNGNPPVVISSKYLNLILASGVGLSKTPFPPPFVLLILRPPFPGSFRPFYLRADNVLGGRLEPLGLCPHGPWTH